MRGWPWVVLLGCGPAVGVPDQGDGRGDDGSTGAMVSTTAATATSATSSTVTGAADVTTSPPPPGSTGAVDTGGFVDDGNTFIIDETGSSMCGGSDCDMFADDCCVGEKCMPWANDGGDVWNATRCIAVTGAAQLGDACTMQGAPVSGVDDCAAGLVCWDVDPSALVGHCVAVCTGSEATPSCADPATACAILYEGTAPLCLPRCDPFAQDCPDGESCILGADAFTCVGILHDGGVYGDPCIGPTECDPGLVCLPSASVPGCTDANCCSSWCDTTVADPDAACPGFADGQVCVAVFADGEAPAGLEGLGLCAGS